MGNRVVVKSSKCWCGRAVQLAEDHLCKQCAEHCEIARYRAGQPLLDPRVRGRASVWSDGA